MEKELFEIARENFLKKEQNLSVYACKSDVYLREEKEQEDIRPPFFHDIDRIIHALSYTRYLNKTQVFSYLDNDHVSKRIVHVQLVSKIARTIARSLGLNEDLTEAIALGHDIGHAPLGHFGESLLNNIAKRELNEVYAHNLQGVRIYRNIENDGKGVNLTIQVLDGILCHNGEMLENRYSPKFDKTSSEFLNDLKMCIKDEEYMKKLKPMTLEGCIVRISDVIAYIGRDIEDAIEIGKIKRSMIPENVKKILGTTNQQIVNTLILDIIKNSLNKPYIELSKSVFDALGELLKFNYENIYNNSMNLFDKTIYKEGIEKIYLKYLNDLKKENKNSEIYEIYLNKMDNKYTSETKKERIVLDFIAGMTDRYFKDQINKYH